MLLEEGAKLHIYDPKVSVCVAVLTRAHPRPCSTVPQEQQIFEDLTYAGARNSMDGWSSSTRLHLTALQSRS